MLPCGEVKNGDIVWLRSGACARVKWFFQVDKCDPIIVDVDVMANVANDPSLFDDRVVDTLLIDSVEVVDACTWYYCDDPHGIRVCIPAVFLLDIA